jgi:hypothetical protein
VDQEFKIVDQFGTYIIKPQNDLFPQLPENEDVTMRMAKVFGLEVPFHGCYMVKMVVCLISLNVLTVTVREVSSQQKILLN